MLLFKEWQRRSWAPRMTRFCFQDTKHQWLFEEWKGLECSSTVRKRTCIHNLRCAFSKVGTVSNYQHLCSRNYRCSSSKTLHVVKPLMPILGIYAKVLFHEWPTHPQLRLHGRAHFMAIHSSWPCPPLKEQILFLQLLIRSLLPSLPPSLSLSLHSSLPLDVVALPPIISLPFCPGFPLISQSLTLTWWCSVYFSLSVHPSAFPLHHSFSSYLPLFLCSPLPAPRQPPSPLLHFPFLVVGTKGPSP